MARYSSQRLLVMDIFKLIASFFVVFIHCQFYGHIGIVVKALARFAVPFFFLCSGYFLYGSDSKKILKKLSRIVKLYCSSILLFALFRFAHFVYENGLLNAIQRFGELFSWNAVIKWIVFNANIFSTHLWYLDAVIYVYVIHWLIQYFRISEKFMFVSSFALLGLHLLIWQIIVTRNSPFVESTFLVRNFILSGYPFIGIGMYICKYREKIPHISFLSMIGLVVLGEVAVILSRFFIGNKSVPAGAIIIALTMLCYATQPHKLVASNWTKNNGTYSTYIYVLHPVVITVVGFVGKYFIFDETSVIWTNLKPFIVCAVSLALAIFMHYFASNRIRRNE